MGPAARRLARQTSHLWLPLLIDHLLSNKTTPHPPVQPGSMLGRLVPTDTTFVPALRLSYAWAREGQEKKEGRGLETGGKKIRQFEASVGLS